MSAYQPKTGAQCGCRRGVQRDNCPRCEGTGMIIDFKAIRACGGEAMTHTAKHTPGPWVAIKGDTFNPERPWGVSKYLSREAHIEIDGDDKEYPCRTEVIAELTETENPQEVEHTAYLIAAAPAMYEALKAMLEHEGERVSSGIGTEHDSDALEAAKQAARAALAQADGKQ